MEDDNHILFLYCAARSSGDVGVTLFMPTMPAQYTQMVEHMLVESGGWLEVA